MNIRRSWICCQIGAREHYAIPRALHAAGRLDSLWTDLWWPPHRLPVSLNHRLSGRYEASLAGVCVQARNSGSLFGRAFSRLRSRAPWDRVIAYNDQFQNWVRKAWRAQPKRAEPPVLFSYSYAARQLFEYAHEAGWPTVLGQIDPGPVEERIVASLRRGEILGDGHWEPAPAAYWDHWRAECALAGTIVVNSEFSRCALITEGVAAEKIRVVPLVLAQPAGATEFVRRYPASFSAHRPLRVLFLGQAGLRKGIHLVMRAAELLKDEPVEIHVVGPVQVQLSEAMRQHPVLRWFGPVPRSGTPVYYRNADVFLFPTFSDGYGLTQLEAQAWQLPVLASRYCGDVVREGENGLFIEPLTAECIAALVRRLLSEPALLPDLAAGSRIADHQTIEGLAGRLDETLRPEPVNGC